MKFNQQRPANGTSDPVSASRAVKRPGIDRDLYKIDEARERLGGISRNTIYELMSSGRLASVKIGRRRFIPSEALESFVADATTTKPPCARKRSNCGVNFASLRLPSSIPD